MNSFAEIEIIQNMTGASKGKRSTPSRFSLQSFLQARSHRRRSSSSDNSAAAGTSTSGGNGGGNAGNGSGSRQSSNFAATTSRFSSLKAKTNVYSKLECPLCLVEKSKENFAEIMTCHHRSCSDCLRQYLRIEITESRINIACPECSEQFHPNDIKMILNDNVLYDKYEEFTLRRILVTDADARWCPAPDCGYAVVATGCAGCPKLHCERPGCDTYFCYHCKQIWHPNQTCDAARQRRALQMQQYHAGGAAAGLGDPQTLMLGDDVKPCPKCLALIIKMDDGSCNHMVCTQCGTEFCWLCLKEISDLHYLSPSGCTFWGKKPWSRKKKILWQLGTLVGAPVGIGLIAGIAVPAMVIGIPVYVGRKIYAKYDKKKVNRHKRNLAITGGVTLSVVLSPVLAALTVGIGVPILLAYVYGVVPISLCRNNSCGVKASESGGMRFSFDEEDEAAAAASTGAAVQAPSSRSGRGPSGETGSGMDGISAVVNASIGEASLSGSTSQMECAGVLRGGDAASDTASTRAIAGTSIASSSLSGSAISGPSGLLANKLEVARCRGSVSSESAILAMGGGDNASTVAMAGSIRDPDGNSVKSGCSGNTAASANKLEVRVDVITPTSDLAAGDPDTTSHRSDSVKSNYSGGRQGGSRGSGRSNKSGGRPSAAPGAGDATAGTSKSPPAPPPLTEVEIDRPNSSC